MRATAAASWTAAARDTLLEEEEEAIGVEQQEEVLQPQEHRQQQEAEGMATALATACTDLQEEKRETQQLRRVQDASEICMVTTEMKATA